MSGKITNPEIVGFLKELAESAGGALSPAAVVEAARPNNSPIHDQFVWDDTEAAKRFRLQQASELLRVTVELIEVKSESYEVRAFTSLSPDRAKDGQSYRATVAVLTNRQMRAQMLADAMAELDAFQKKYATLSELSEVFAAIRKARKK